MAGTGMPAQNAPERRQVAAFVAIVLAVLSGCWLAVSALASPLLPGGAWTAALLYVLFTLIPLAVFIATRALGVYAGALVRVLIFRPLWYAQFFVLLLAPLGLAAALVGLPLGHAAGAGRAAVAGGGALLALFWIAGYVGSRRLEVRRLVAVFPELPPSLEGLVVAQLSDLHVGPHTSRRFLQRVCEEVHGAAPDVIAVTGDLVDDFPGDVERYAAGLGSLAAPLGVYAIPGNHEVYSGWRELRPRLEALPLQLLVNRSVLVRRNGGAFWVAGTGDPAGGRGGEVAPDIERSLQGVPPGGFVLALAHNPALWPALARRGVALTLSGHTHWGQLSIPRLDWCLASPFLDLAMGVHERDGCLLYIHPGTGYWGIPFRLGHAAQVAVVTLRRGERAEIRDELTGELRDAELRVVTRGQE
jgi:predicted MPP superfamily phosphohydrolase